MRSREGLARNTRLKSTINIWKNSHCDSWATCVHYAIKINETTTRVWLNSMNQTVPLIVYFVVNAFISWGRFCAIEESIIFRYWMGSLHMKWKQNNETYPFRLSIRMWGEKTTNYDVFMRITRWILSHGIKLHSAKNTERGQAANDKWWRWQRTTPHTRLP